MENEAANKINIQTVTLHNIYKEAYERVKDEYTAKFQHYKKTLSDRLTKIFEVLNIDIEEFRVDINKNIFEYQIPVVYKPLFLTFLISDGKKGSFISKIINDKAREITVEEKQKFIEDLLNEYRAAQREYNISDKEIQNVEKTLNDLIQLEISINKVINLVEKEMFFKIKQNLYTISGVTSLNILTPNINRMIKKKTTLPIKSENCIYGSDSDICLSYTLCKDFKKKDDCNNCVEFKECIRCCEFESCKSLNRISYHSTSFQNEDILYIAECYLSMLQEATNVWNEFVIAFSIIRKLDVFEAMVDKLKIVPGNDPQRTRDEIKNNFDEWYFESKGKGMSSQDIIVELLLSKKKFRDFMDLSILKNILSKETLVKIMKSKTD